MSTTLVRQVIIKNETELFHGYLAKAPLAHALFRCSELSYLTGRRISRPVLDLGCGTGEFASIAVNEFIDTGVDISASRLQSAHKSGLYSHLIRADAGRLPFCNQAFSTVLCVSVLEHLAEPDQALFEVNRMLRGGGEFIGTVVLADLHSNLLYPKVLRKLGLSGFAHAYEK